jgi:hypothetical protein
MEKKKTRATAIPYTPREWQLKATSALSRFTVLVLHRRAGKTVFDVIQSIGQVLSCKLKNPRGAYFGPTRAQTKDTAWDYYKMFLKPLKDKGLVIFNETDLSIKFLNGARINLYSYENLDNIRGIYLDHCVLDEFQLAPLETFDKIVRPMLSDRQGKAIITGTPNGKNQFFDFYERGLDQEYPNWSSVLMTYSDTQVILPEEIEELIKESSEEAFAQEYKCSFEAAIKGAYFGKNISKLKESERVGKFPYDPAYPVVTGWDIGFDGMVIWYCQKIGEEIRIIDIDYFENKDLPYCVNKVINKPYVYEYQLIPHDGKKRSILDKKKTAKGQLENFGLKVKVVPKGSFDDGIHATRNFIDSVVFSEKCDKKIRMGRAKISPLDSLSLYSAKVDDDAGVMQKNARHDRHSHIADGLRTLAVGLKNNKISGIKALQSRHRPSNMQKDLINNSWDPFSIYN